MSRHLEREEQTNINFRIPVSLGKEFYRICKINAHNPSELLRQSISNYIHNIQNTTKKEC